MSMTSLEFYEKFKDYLSLPDNCMRFSIVGEAGEALLIHCVLYTGEIENDELVTKQMKYKLVAIDD